MSTNGPNQKGTSRMGLADELCPLVPAMDDHEAASEILNYVLDRTLALTEEIQRYAEARYDQAPTSARHAGELTGEISGVTIEWIRRWPA